MGKSVHDYYQTPASAIDPLLRQLHLKGIYRFLEPCRGEGNIYKRVHAEHKLWCEIREGRNYLDTHYRKPVNVIITNPPFTVWREFLTKSLRECPDGLVCYLLRLNVLGSGMKTNRRDFWNRNKPQYLFPLSKRPSFVGGGTDMTDYAWFVWDRDATGRVKKSELDWLTVL